MMADVAPTDGSERSRLAETYVRPAPEAIRLAYLLTGDRALAEDLAQEAFVRFVARLHYIRDRHAVDAYLRRTIVNLSRNSFRRRAAERSFLERQAGHRQPEHGRMGGTAGLGNLFVYELSSGEHEQLTDSSCRRHPGTSSTWTSARRTGGDLRPAQDRV